MGEDMFLDRCQYANPSVEVLDSDIDRMNTKCVNSISDQPKLRNEL